MFKNVAVVALNTRLRSVKSTRRIVSAAAGSDERDSINAHVSARRAVLDTAAGALTLSWSAAVSAVAGGVICWRLVKRQGLFKPAPGSVGYVSGAPSVLV